MKYEEQKETHVVIELPMPTTLKPINSFEHKIAWSNQLWYYLNENGISVTQLIKEKHEVATNKTACLTSLSKEEKLSIDGQHDAFGANYLDDLWLKHEGR